MDNLVIYKVDVGNTISGYTFEVKAHTAQSAYDQAIKLVDKDKFHQVIQIRDERDFIVYSYLDQDGLFPKMRE